MKPVQLSIRAVLGWRGPTKMFGIDATFVTPTAAVSNLVLRCRGGSVRKTAHHAVGRLVTVVYRDRSGVSVLFSERPNQAFVAFKRHVIAQPFHFLDSFELAPLSVGGEAAVRRTETFGLTAMFKPLAKLSAALHTLHSVANYLSFIIHHCDRYST